MREHFHLLVCAAKCENCDSDWVPFLVSFESFFKLERLRARRGRLAQIHQQEDKKANEELMEVRKRVNNDNQKPVIVAGQNLNEIKKKLAEESDKTDERDDTVQTLHLEAMRELAKKQQAEARLAAAELTRQEEKEKSRD